MEIEPINTSKDFEVTRSNDNSLVKKMNTSINTSINNEQSNDNTSNPPSGDTKSIKFKDSLSSISSILNTKELEEKIKLLTTENVNLKKELESSKSKLKERETIIEKQNEEIKSLKNDGVHLNSDSDLLSLSLEKKYSSNDLTKKKLKNISFNNHNRLHSLNYSEVNFRKFKTQQNKHSSKLDFINKKIKDNQTSKKNINSKEDKEEIKKEEDKLIEEAKQLCYKSIKNFRQNNNIPENITNEEIAISLKANNYDNKKALTYLLNK